ncbi:mpv17-like protein 2 isoform X1 [Strongylocentrotus purpuratus]|uniref:Mpv17-like protein 2 n=1 Tax=Strongylocentrotus purpuratus TaxID=7668 RepID=A0A7M7PM46_STRPU|nr:mpv17-like protein 2 isoform X1 [Strongylocentrotus purpuratus]
MIRHITRKLFSPKYLVWTNIASGGIILTCGDAVEQYREILKKRKQQQIQRWNMKRTGCMFAIGIALGPFNHYWYVYLDRFLPGIAASTVATKIVLDEIIASPVLTISFLVGLGLCEGKPLSDCGTMVKEKFPTIWMFDLCFWPTIQWINFYYLPPRARVIYVNSVTFLWDMFLSFMVYDYKSESGSEGSISESQQKCA